MLNKQQKWEIPYKFSSHFPNFPKLPLWFPLSDVSLIALPLYFSLRGSRHCGFGLGIATAFIDLPRLGFVFSLLPLSETMRVIVVRLCVYFYYRHSRCTRRYDASHMT